MARAGLVRGGKRGEPFLLLRIFWLSRQIFATPRVGRGGWSMQGRQQIIFYADDHYDFPGASRCTRKFNCSSKSILVNTIDPRSGGQGTITLSTAHHHYSPTLPIRESELPCSILCLFTFQRIPCQLGEATTAPHNMQSPPQLPSHTKHTVRHLLTPIICF